MIRISNITYFLLANFITYLGNGIQILGAAYIAYQEVNSILAIGGVFLSYAIPQLFASYLSLTVIRNFGVKNTCYYSDIIRGLLILCIFIAVYFDTYIIEVTLIITATSSLFDAIYQPASNSFFQKIVTNESLSAEKSSAKLETTTQIAMLLSVTIGALIGHFLGVQTIFLINAISFLISAYLFYNITGNFNKTDNSVVKTSSLYFQTIKTNFIDVLNFSLVRAVPNTMNTLTIFFVIAILSENFVVLGIVDAVASIGFMLGSMFFSKYLVAKRMVPVMFYSLLLTAIFIMLQPIYDIYFMSIMFFLATFTFGISRVAARSEIIKTIPDDVADRIYSVAAMLGLLFAITLTLLVCWVQPNYGIIPAYGIVAIFVSIVAFMVLYSSKNSRS